MPDVHTLVDDYIATWNESDPARRRELISRTFADDADYLDPLMQGTGADAIDGMIAGAQQQYPGHSFTLAAGPDAHHDRLRFSWHMIGADGAPVAVGVDFATLTADGRLRSVTGFFEQPS